VIDFQVNSGGDITISFDGYEGGCGREFELRLDEFPTIELWKRRRPTDSLNLNIPFSQNSNQTTLGNKLVQYLTQVDGDTASTYKSLDKYYKKVANIRQCKVNSSEKRVKKRDTMGKQAEAIDDVQSAKDLMSKELDPTKLKHFFAKADHYWYDMPSCVIISISISSMMSSSMKPHMYSCLMT